MKRILAALALAALALTLGLTPLHAATLIVDNQNPRAADTNSGTRQAPLKTINAAAGRVQPGDTVLVRPGLTARPSRCAFRASKGSPSFFKAKCRTPRLSMAPT